MSLPSFETFRDRALAQGFDEVLERVWAPGQQVGEHTHSFDVEALVVAGEFLLRTGGQERRLRAGDTFSVPRDTPHSEQYGDGGATFWVARRR